MKTRKAKLIVNKTGGGSSTFRATIPNKWARKLGLGESIRNLEISFDGTQIIIKNDKEMNDMELTKIEKKHERLLEMLEELGKVNTDNIDNISGTIKELELLGHRVYLEEGYLILDIEQIALDQIEKITKCEEIVTLEQIDGIMELRYVFADSAGLSGTGEGELFVLYLIDKDGYKTDIELAELVVGK